MSESEYVLCIPADEPWSVPSVTRWCSVCGDKVWLSETMDKIGDLIPVCMDCAAGVLAIAGPDVQFEIHPDQERELRTAGILGEVHQAVSQMNRAMRRARRGR